MVCLDWPRDVLEVLLTSVVEIRVNLSSELFVGCPRNQKITGLAQLLQSGRNVDTIPEQVVTVHHDITEIDAYAKNDPVCGTGRPLFIRQCVLDRDCARDSLNHRAELGDQPIAHQFDQPAGMSCNQWTKHRGL
jgi:hypothetical protein